MEAKQSAELLCLLDVYGAMLTERQREMMVLRLEEDLSLAEIAENFSVSRQAVHDALRRAELTLQNMEEKLLFYHKDCRVRKQAQQALSALNAGDMAVVRSMLLEIACTRES